MFTHLNLINPIELKTKEGPKGRFYITPDGNVYPSVTTVLGAADKPWLRDWRASLGVEKADAEMKRAAARGSAVHLMAERFLNNEPNPCEGQRLDHIGEFNSLRLYLKKIDNILTQETAVWSDTLKLAGRVDVVGEYQGRLAIIDFKTSNNSKSNDKIEDYWLQTCAYALMFQERYDIQIDDAVIIMSVEKGPGPLVFKRKIEPYIEPLLRRINSYHTGQQ